jgi:hypothetical protein
MDDDIEDQLDQPTPEEIADVTGGDADKIRDGMAAFEWVDDDKQDTGPCGTENIDETPGVHRDIRAPLRDYRRKDWHFEQDEGDGGEAGEGV